MKTEIIYQHDLEDEFGISKVVVFNNNSFGILSGKYPNKLKLEVINENWEKLYSCMISELPELQRIFEFSIFTLANSFGLIGGTQKLILWNNQARRLEITDISNPFLPDRDSYKHHTINASFNRFDKALYVSLEDKKMSGFPARYWSRLDLNGNNATWGNLNELNLNHFPNTEFSKYPETEWLNICDLMIKDSKLYIHTTGGTTTRLKSGKRYEFSIVSELTADNEVLKNNTVAEGEGIFSADKNYFVLHPRDNRRKLYFYNTINFELDFEISLTSKQNLGQQKSNFILSTSMSDYICIYNALFLNICKLIRQ